MGLVTNIPIYTTTLASGQSSVTFSSFSGYKNLKIVVDSRRGIDNAGEASLGVTFNGDGGTNYSSTLLYESSPYATRESNSTKMNYLGACGDTRNLTTTIYIFDYANNSTYKSSIARFGYGAPNNIDRFAVGAWRSTAPITTITMTPSNGFAAGSIFTVYGIK